MWHLLHYTTFDTQTLFFLFHTFYHEKNEYDETTSKRSIQFIYQIVAFLFPSFVKKGEWN